MSASVLLEALDIDKAFPGVHALKAASLRVKPGRLLALLGENGAGKSTFMNILSGALRPDSGSIKLCGEELLLHSPRMAQDCGIGIVHQELNLIQDLSISENIWLGREPRSSLGLLDYARMHRDTEAILAQLDLHAPPTLRVSELRVGQQQLVEIGKALSFNTRVLILDEPTSSLSAHEVQILFKVIQDLKARGVGLVYITHKFEELAHICDDVTIMRDGAVVSNGLYSEMTRDFIVRQMAGREAGGIFTRQAAAQGPELLKVEGLTLQSSGSQGKRLVDAVSFTLRKGEVLGIFGLVGAGRTELLEAIFGLHPTRTEGRVLVNGQGTCLTSPAEAIRAGIALAPEDRKRDGVILSMSVAANASLASLHRTLKAGLVNKKREAAYLSPFFSRFRLKTSSVDELIVNLSGGNQQKVILAKWLATQPAILLLDEPTRGIDVNAKREIYAFIDELARNGLAIVVVSSELPEILALSDRILVMCEGKKTAEFEAGEASSEKILHAALPDFQSNTLPQ